MAGILAFLLIIILYNCGNFIPDSIREWWEYSTLRKWIHPIIAVTLTIAVALGIQFDILNWGAIILPVLYGFPYILGMVLGIWHNLKNAGHRVTFKYGTEAKEIALKCLRELGCQPEICVDGSIGISYRGENFHMEFGGRYARVWDPMLAGVKADDPDLPKIREAVNAVNFNFGPTVVMTAPNDEGIIGIHSRRDIMLHPACPDNVPFLKAVLDSFFDAKEQVYNSFQQINAKQMEAQQNRRPVGFTTTNDD